MYYKLRYLLFFIFFLPYFASASEIDTSNCTARTFIVSGYYSAVSGQDFYYRSDYSRELRLNGMGTHGASGKAVFNGMIAAPRNYEFGKKIYFPGHGVGEVHDRGQAIVNAGERGYSHDRIDIWMGYGEEGLKRALSFGKKRMSGYVCGGESEAGFDFDSFKVHQEFFDVALWSVYLSPGRRDEFVRTMQSYLHNLGYVSYENITGFFGPITRDAVCKFQENKGLASRGESVCGYFGPRTRQAMKDKAIELGYFDNNMYKNYENNLKFQEDEILTEEKEDSEDIALAAGIEESDEEKAQENTKDIESKEKKGFVFERSLGKGSSGEDVLELQKKLYELGYFEGDKTSKYDSNTISSVYSFQKDKGIVDSDTPLSVRGFFGPSTREELNNI